MEWISLLWFGIGGLVISTLGSHCGNSRSLSRFSTNQFFSQDTTLFGLYIKPGIKERGAECGELGEWGERYIWGNVSKYSGKCRQTFWGMSLYITGNVIKHSREFCQIFREMSPNIPGDVTKLLSLISECFTVHYLLISSNQSEYLHSFPVCKSLLLANPKGKF